MSRWHVIHPAAQSIAILKGEKDSFPLHIAVTKILCEDLPQVVLKQCDELEFVNINMTSSPGLGCLKADKKE